jgi:glycine/D-amino acid oxidase-like deaminating enzyme
MKTTWQRTFQMGKIYPALVGTLHTDVVVIGGGITGTTVAYLLAKAGKQVIVLEKGTVADSSTTAYTTAFLAMDVDTSLSDLKKIFGKQHSHDVWRSGEEAISMVEKIVREEGIDCEFSRMPEYIFARTEKEWDMIATEMHEAQKANFSVELYKHGKHLPFKNNGYALLPNQAKFHPLKYVDGLRRSAEKYGAVFFEHSEAQELADDDHVQVTTSMGKVIATWAVIATYNPFNKPKELFGKKGTYTSYICECSIPQRILPEGLYLDADNPYHYFRVDRGEMHDRLIIGGEDHRKEIKMDPKKNYTALLEYAEKIIGASKYSVITRWNGPILETWDGLPFIGPYSKNFPHHLVATGFSGNGMTYSMIAGMILTDRILGKPNPYAVLYDPRRGYSLTALWIKGRDYIDELIHGALRNIFRRANLKDKLSV